MHQQSLNKMPKLSVIRLKKKIRTVLVITQTKWVITVLSNKILEVFVSFKYCLHPLLEMLVYT